MLGVEVIYLILSKKLVSDDGLFEGSFKSAFDDLYVSKSVRTD